jgi:hypothetical protein
VGVFDGDMEEVMERTCLHVNNFRDQSPVTRGRKHFFYLLNGLHPEKICHTNYSRFCLLGLDATGVGPPLLSKELGFVYLPLTHASIHSDPIQAIYSMAHGCIIDKM